MTTRQLEPVLRHIRRLAAAGGGRAWSDGQLLQAFAADGDQAAFAALVERHGRLVLSVCRRVLRHEHDAEDAFQATFLVLARKAGSIRKQDALPSWLYGVAYRTAMKARASAARRHAREEKATPRSTGDAAGDAALRELQAVLAEEVGWLPQKLRAPVVLCCLEGKSKAEAAQELGWKEGTVSGRLAQGRQRLQQRLARRGVALSAALGACLLPESGLAAVPPALAVAAVRGALLFAAGIAGKAATVPARVTALAEAVLRALPAAKLKTVTAVLLLLTLVGVGAAVFAPPGRKPPPAGSKPVARSEPASRPLDPRPDTDRSGDPLPAGARARLGTTRLRHQHTIKAVRFSRDGKLIVSGAWDDTARLWDAATGRELRRLADPGKPISAVDLSPDGKVVAAGNLNQTFVLWGAATGKELFRSPKLENNVLSLRFSPDGKLLATESGPVVRLWDVARRRELRRCTEAPSLVWSLVFSPNGKTLAAGCEHGVVCLWDTTTGEALRRLRGPEGGILSIDISGDGKRLACSVAGRGACLWDLATGRQLRRLAGAGAVAFAPGGKTLAVGGEGMIRLYDVAGGTVLRRCRLRGADRGGIGPIAFSPDGTRLVAPGRGKTLQRWDPATGKEIDRLPGHENEIRAAAFTPDRKLLATADADGSVYLWRPADGGIVRHWRIGTGLNAMALAMDGKNLATAGGNVIRLWDPAMGKEVRQLVGHQGAVDAVAFSPDRLTLASGGWQDHTIRLWDVATGKERYQLALPRPHGVNYGSTPLVFSPDGKLLFSGSADRANSSIYVWEAATGKQLHRFALGAGRLALSPDGKSLAVSGWDGVRLLDSATGTEFLRWSVRAGPAAFSPDGKVLAGGDLHGVIHVWELVTGKERRRFVGHETGGYEGGYFAAGVSALAFSPDGRTLVSGGGDTTVLLWDLFPTDGPSRPPAEDFWDDLGSPDAARAYRAICSAMAVPQRTLRLLTEHLPPARRADPRRIEQLIKDLDSSRFADRRRASRQLEQLEERAAALFQKSLGEKPSAEARRRIEWLVMKLRRRPPSASVLRAVRATELLEHLDLPEATALLRALARGAPDSRLTREAKAALERLRRRGEPRR
jgi:RNA polymerase sigma factor (sigma-70 family)